MNGVFHDDDAPKEQPWLPVGDAHSWREAAML